MIGSTTETNDAHSASGLFELFDAMQQGEMEIAAGFTKVWAIFEKQITSLLEGGENAQKSLSDLSKKIDEKEAELDTISSQRNAEIEKGSELLSSLKEKDLDRLASDLNNFNEMISNIENRHASLRTQKTLCQSELNQNESQWRNLSKVFKEEDTALVKKFEAQKKWRRDINSRLRSVKKESNRLIKEAAELQKEIDDLARRYSGHSHSFSYRSMGNCCGARSGGPSK